jgi:hypothetical protein
VKKLEKCRICENTDLVKVLSLGNQFLTGVFPRFREQKISCGPLELVKCHGENGCSLLQLGHSYDSSEMYGENYGYRSGLNQSMVQHLGRKVSSLLRLRAPAPQDVFLDIGSNDGTLLSFYPEGPRLFGMDPTAAKFEAYYQKRIHAIPDFFSAEKFLAATGGRKAGVVTSIAMLYDLEEPLAFVRQISQVLERDGIWHFEQSYMPSMIEENAYDTICHEHLEYYGLSQINWMLTHCGMKIVDVEVNAVNGGSFAITAAHQNAPFTTNASRVNELLAAEQKYRELEPYRIFAGNVASHRDQLCGTIADLRQSGASVLGYGASTKGNVILQYCGFTEAEIPAIAEVNPDKFGAFTPGTLIPIVSEQDARTMKPDVFLVLPWHFKDNLLAREQAFLEGGGRMLFPLPSIATVGA